MSRWNAPRGREPSRRAPAASKSRPSVDVHRATTLSARRSLGHRSRPRRPPSGPATSVAAVGHDRQLLLRDVALGRAQPARVLETDVGQHLDRATRSRWSRRSGRRGPPRPRPTSTPAPRRAPSRRRRSAPRTASRGRRRLERAVDQRGRLRGALRPPSAKRSSRRPAPVDLDPLGERAQVRRQVGAGATAVRARGSRRSCAPSTTCRWCRRRGSTRSARCGEPSAVISRRMRSSPKRMPNSSSDAGSARPRAASERPGESAATSRARPARASKRSSFSARLHQLGRRLVDEPLVCELALGALDLGAQRVALGLVLRRPPLRGRRVARQQLDRRAVGVANALATVAVAAVASASSNRASRAIACASARRRRSASLGTIRAGIGARPVPRPSRGSCAAGARPRSRASTSRSASLVDQRSVGLGNALTARSPSRARQERVDLLGHERHQRVRQRERLARARSSSVAETRPRRPRRTGAA